MSDYKHDIFDLEEKNKEIYESIKLLEKEIYLNNVIIESLKSLDKIPHLNSPESDVVRKITALAPEKKKNYSVEHIYDENYDYVDVAENVTVYDRENEENVNNKETNE